MKLRHLLFSVITLATIASCKKPDKHTPEPTEPEVKKEVDVYIAGYTTNANDITVATIWKNGVPQVLTSTPSMAMSIAVKGNDVYVVGESLTQTGKYVATYWKNGMAKKLTDSLHDSRAVGIELVRNDIHVIGNIYHDSHNPSAALYWKNDILQTLNFTATYATLEAIKAHGNDVYIVGSVGIPLVSKNAVYWKNGANIVLPGSAIVALDIAFNNDNVYVLGGKQLVAENMDLPVIWKNGVPASLPDEASLPRAWSIAVHKDTVYIGGTINRTVSGYTPSISTYWKNGSAIKLTDGTAESDVNSIAVNFDDVYVSGSALLYIGAKPLNRAVYWQNGKLYPLSNTHSYASKLILVPRN